MSLDLLQKFAYEIVGNCAVIWRCFSRTASAVIPSWIDGYPVTEVAPYAFSAHMSPSMLNGKKYTSQEDLPELCGERLEEIILSETVSRVGRYCFYNCSNLRRISFTDAQKDWGSGTFTGCHHVKELEVRMIQSEQTTLKDVLVELQEELEVDYIKEGENGYYAKLVFPEYYEEGVENTPARLINLEIHGSGMRFRNCFQKRVFDFGEYDIRFPYAIFQEKFAITASMAEYRLRYPHGLHQESRQRYEDYLLEHGSEYGEFLIDRKAIDGIIWFTELVFARKELLGVSVTDIVDHMIDYAARKQYQEAVSFLMDYRHRCGGVKKKKSYDFDL